MLSNFKAPVEQRLSILGRALAWINPNVLTLIGIIPQALFFYFMLHGQFLAAAIALCFSILDLLDGLIARATNRVTAFGGFLDSTTDRIGDFLLIAGFYFADLISLPIFLTLLMATYLISYARARAELASNNTIKFDVGLIERPERIIFLIIVLILQWAYPTVKLTEPLVLTLTILSIFTFGQRVWAAFRNL